MENIKEWLSVDTNSDGSGYSTGYGYNTGAGDGSGYSTGYGYSTGAGDGSGYGTGRGAGLGAGDGAGLGAGDGAGDGSGCGAGISYISGQTVYQIDGVQTIITRVRNAVGKGFILHSDFTTTPCYVVKGQGYFAHGETLRAARESLQGKIFSDMDTEKAIAEFIKRFEKGKKYKGTEFFEWHHYLTGSCLMGRKSFVRNHGLNVEDTFTVEEFIAICEDDYGSEIIKELKEKWSRL